MRPNTYLDRYRVLTDHAGDAVVLERDATGVTYRAEDIHTRDVVALRLVDFEPAARDQAERDAAAARQLDHINVPAVLACAVEGDQLVCATELLDGTTAEEWVTAHGPMPVGDGLRIALQVVNALGAATFHGLVRQPINPRDILLVPGQTAEGEWPLIKVMNFTDLSPAQVGGSAADSARKFASPEQQLGAATDFRSQIYSLGATLGFLLTGTMPAGAGALQGSGLPKTALHLLTQMLATDPAQRPQDPLAFQEQIRTCLVQVERREAIGRRFGIPVVPAQAAMPAAPSSRLLLQPLAFAAVLLVLGALVALLFANGYTPSRLFSARDEKPLGVPIGVPEETALAKAEPAPVESAATPSETTAVSTPEPRALVAANTPAPDPVEQTPPSPEIAPAPAGVEPAAPATVENSESEAAARMLAANTSTPPEAPAAPAPPSQGPDRTAWSTETASSTQSARPVEQTENDRVPAPPTIASNEPARSAAAATREPEPATGASSSADRKPAARPAPSRGASSSRKSSDRIARREVRRALPPDDFDSGLPALPPRSKRARYVGTAPDGSLMFELPSAERVYAAPPAYRGDRRLRRRFRPPIPDDELPILPAEPVDE